MVRHYYNVKYVSLKKIGQAGKPPLVRVSQVMFFRNLIRLQYELIFSIIFYRYIYTILSKNLKVTDSNRTLLVESFRSMAEILIWGDQNNPAVFE